MNESVRRLDVDQDKPRALGVSSQSIAQSARVINVGATIGQYREGDQLIDIVLRQPAVERDSSRWREPSRKARKCRARSPPAHH